MRKNFASLDRREKCFCKKAFGVGRGEGKIAAAAVAAATAAFFLHF